MKDSWLQEQWLATKNATNLSNLPEVTRADKVIHQRGGGTFECTTPLKDGNVLVICFDDHSIHEMTIYSPNMRKLEKLKHGNVPHDVTRCYLLFRNVFVTIDSDEPGEVQTLWMHDASTGRNGANTIEFRDDLIHTMTAVILGDNRALVILGDDSGRLHIIRYENEHLYRQEIITDVHRQAVGRVGSFEHKFWATSNDGLVTVWDVDTKKLMGRIENHKLVDLVMNELYVMTDVDCVVRVYENRPGLKLKWVVKLPILDESLSFVMYEFLTNTVGVLHDEHYELIFFDMRYGTVISRVKSPFKSVHSLWILADASLLLTSDLACEGHAIMCITKPDVVFAALCQYACDNYPCSNLLLKQCARRDRCKWHKWAVCAASLVLGVVKIHRRLTRTV